MDTEVSKKLGKSVLWNTVGALFFLVCQWLITVLVVRFSDDYTNAGILSLAMSVTNIFAIIALFNVRNYQVSDTEERFSASDYVSHRIVTCLAALILCIAVALIGGYPPVTAVCIIAYMVLKLTENFADVFHGIAQKRWRLDIVGISFIIRGTLIVGVFTVAFLLTKNLAVTLSLMAVSNVLALLLYDFNKIRKLERLSLKIDKEKIFSLSKICLPMVGYGLCIHSIMPLAKCILEAYHGEEALGYYGSVTTVATLIQAFSIMIFTPLIGVFTEHYRDGDRRALVKLILKLLVMILAITALASLATALLGEWAMVLVFGEEIRDYVYLLYPTIVASSLTAFVWLMGMLLVVMRAMKTLLIGSLAGLAVSVALSFALIPGTVYTGTNIALIVGFSVITLIYLLRFAVYVAAPATMEKD
ncbi:MAG: hypothetical protein IJW48_02990 [Clostridia bacterium]|nr:hypothetical protein [Clostridia bacterium]